MSICMCCLLDRNYAGVQMQSLTYCQFFWYQCIVMEGHWVDFKIDRFQFQDVKLNRLYLKANLKKKNLYTRTLQTSDMIISKTVTPNAFAGVHLWTEGMDKLFSSIHLISLLATWNFIFVIRHFWINLFLTNPSSSSKIKKQNTNYICRSPFKNNTLKRKF